MSYFFTISRLTICRNSVVKYKYQPSKSLENALFSAFYLSKLFIVGNTESFNDSKWFDRSAPFTVSFLFPAMIDRERDFCPLFAFPCNQPRPEPIFSPEMEKGLRGAYEKARHMDKYIKDTSIQILREKVAKRKLAAQREEEKRAKEQKEEELSETMSLEEALDLLNMCDTAEED